MTIEEVLAAIANMGEEELAQVEAALAQMLAPTQEGDGDQAEREGEEPAGEVSEQVQQMIDAIGEDLDALEEVLNGIEGRRSTITKNAERRSAVIKRLKNGEGRVIRKFEEGEKMPEFDEKKEYRNAWLNKVRGIPMNDAQKRAYSNTVGSGAEVIPEELQNDILTKVKTLVPMLGEITLLHVKGNVRYAVEGVTNDAAIHTENAEMSAAEDTLTEVMLGAYEITKLVRISDTVKTMSINAFASWITDRLAEVLSRKIENYIINGDGEDEPTGIEKANTWGETNSVTVAAASSLSAANVQTLIGLLNAGYDRKAKILMNKRTLFTDFMPLQDSSKHALVSVEGGNYYIYGYPVMLSDYVANHEAYLGDFTKYVANMAEDIVIHDDYEIKTNSYLYSGVCIFDGKPGLGEAFVKLAKAQA